MAAPNSVHASVDSGISTYKTEKYCDYSVSIALYIEIVNCSELRTLVMDGKLDAALIDNRLVSCINATVLAALKA